MLTFPWTVLLALGGMISSGQSNHHGHDGLETATSFSNRWVVHMDNTDEDSARLLAAKMGYSLVGQVPDFPGFFVMEKSDHPLDNKEEALRQTRAFRSEVKVLFAQQLFNKIRDKRFVVPDEGRHYKLSRSSKTYRKKHFEKKDGSENLEFNDRIWNSQWYMNQNQATRTSGVNVDINVLPVWSQGITGKGVNVTVLDDGIEWKHQDLVDNFSMENSRNFINAGMEGNTNVEPSQTSDHHGTRCAGEIAMRANDGICGVGVAYMSTISMVKMLSKTITDQLEGQSLNYALNKIHVYSASWGPTDNGKTLEGPGYIASHALAKGAKEGRGGLGVIYVWAAGNGRANGDNCNADGYTSSIYTLSVSSVSERGNIPWYSEICASTLASTPSSGSGREREVSTTDVGNSCTDSHTGTSASAPLAAGMVALVLEANNNLTWRDVQHITVRTSQYVPTISGWKRNGAGLEYNPAIGFGLMDTKAMVDAAIALKGHNVGPQLSEEFEPTTKNLEQHTQLSQKLDIKFTVKDQKIQHLEHVEVVSNIEMWKRGCLEAYIISPQGTSSKVMRMRSKDLASVFEGWRFMSVHFWAENPSGEWTFSLVNGCTTSDPNIKLGDHKLVLYGTEEEPEVTKLLIPESHELSKKALSSKPFHVNLEGKDWDDLIGQKMFVRQTPTG